MIDLEALISPLLPGIREAHHNSCCAAGFNPGSLELELASLPYNAGGPLAEFAAVDRPPRVRCTWNGLASLWCFVQALVRVAKPCMEARRQAIQLGIRGSFALNYTSEMQEGAHLFELALELRRSTPASWPSTVIIPNVSAAGWPNGSGNQLFYNAFGWICRHEVGHIQSGHLAVEVVMPDDFMAQEREADRKATEWMKGDTSADFGRVLETEPSRAEVMLEQRALPTILGLLWVAHGEFRPHGRSTTHPETVGRMQAALSVLDVAQDSAALEVLADTIKFLIDPDGPTEECADTMEAFYGALGVLNRRIFNARS